LNTSNVSLNQLPLKLRPVDVSDLMGRELVQADIASIQEFFLDKRVLITGAGGSIGSELAKIICQSLPRELILVEHSENNLYEIETDLRERPGGAAMSCYLRDMTNHYEMEKIFRRHEPQIVYHAAASKHVPMVEMNFAEGIVNNVLGTKTVADLATKVGVGHFILISSDKAIRPHSIMGATKRIAELYTQSLKGVKTRFLAVRFGNVFNSKGSAVPLFRKQIEQGGPITITDKRVQRYFMDVSEAVFLILQATVLGTKNEVFVLDMGAPVKILDLVRNLVQLMGLSPDEIPIQYIGLRPGEKLTEDLELEGEKSLPTTHKKIKIWKSNHRPSASISQEVDRLLDMIRQKASRDDVVQCLKAMIPEYDPWQFPTPK